MAERSIERSWVEQTINEPSVTIPDSGNASLTRAFRSIPERQGKMLRVVYRQSGESKIVITAFFDRGYRG